MRRRESRSRSWRSSTVGPYTVVRRWRWAGAAARCFEAFNRLTGAPAVLLKPGRLGDWAPSATAWSATVSSTPEALAVELVPHPRGARQLQEVTLAFHRLTNALANLDTQPAPQAALAGDVAALRVWRARYSTRPGLVAGLAAVALLGVWAAPRTEHGGRVAAVKRGAVVQVGSTVPGLPVAMAPRAPFWRTVALDMPPKPFKGQVRTDAEGKCAADERAIIGACWVELKATAPCSAKSYEWRGGCYLPVWPAPREDTSAAP